MDNQNNTDSTLLKMAKLAYAVMKDKDAPFHLRREASEALIEFDVCDLIFTKEAKATISALNGLMKLCDKPGEFVTLANGAETVAPSHVAPMLRAFREAKAKATETRELLSSKALQAAEFMYDLMKDESAPVKQRMRAAMWLAEASKPKAIDLKKYPGISFPNAKPPLATDVREFLASKTDEVAGFIMDTLGHATVLVEAEPNSDAVKFVNALNEGKYGETPVKPDENDVISNFTKAVDDIVSQTAKIGRPCGFAREYCQVILDQHFAKGAVDDIRDKLNGK